MTIFEVQRLLRFFEEHDHSGMIFAGTHRHVGDFAFFVEAVCLKQTGSRTTLSESAKEIQRRA